MSAHTLSAADLRGAGITEYTARLILNDPSLSKKIRFGPKGGGGTRFFIFRQLLPILRAQPKFTEATEMKIAALDQRRRKQGIQDAR